MSRAEGMWAALQLSKVATNRWKEEGQTEIPHWALTNLFIDEIARLEDKPWSQVVSELNERLAEDS